jgi:hypothetical protein
MRTKNNKLRNANGLKKVTLPRILILQTQTKACPEYLQAYKAPAPLI